MINARKTVESGNTPEKITLSMIDQDLKDGVSKADMAIKYNIKPWEVDEMFKHPFLKGRRPSRKKALSFSFVDDMTNEPIIDPNQVTLEQAIDNAIETVENVKAEMQDTQEAILDILSPTEYETPEETLLKAAQDTSKEKTFDECLDTVVDESTGETLKDTLTHPDYKNQTDREDNDPEYQKEDELEMDDDEVKLPSFEDTLDLVQEQQEEELDMEDDDTFTI